MGLPTEDKSPEKERKNSEKGQRAGLRKREGCKLGGGEINPEVEIS